MKRKGASNKENWATNDTQDSQKWGKGFTALFCLYEERSSREESEPKIELKGQRGPTDRGVTLWKEIKFIRTSNHTWGVAATAIELRTWMSG